LISSTVRIPNNGIDYWHIPVGSSNDVPAKLTAGPQSAVICDCLDNSGGDCIPELNDDCSIGCYDDGCHTTENVNGHCCKGTVPLARGAGINIPTKAVRLYGTGYN